MHPAAMELNARAAREGRLRWRTEIAAGFPLLQSIRSSLVQTELGWLKALPEGRVQAAADALVARRFERPTKEQSVILAESDAAFVEGIGLALWPPPEGVDRRLLRKLVYAALPSIAGPVLGNPAKEAWMHQKPIAGGWSIRTSVDVGGRTRDLEYRHSLIAPDSENVLGTTLIGLLGVGSSTNWNLLSRGAEEPTVKLLVELTGRFVDEVAPKLVQGL